MSIVLGIDPGERHLGLALSDPMGMIASPLQSVRVRTPEAMFEVIVETVRQTGAQTVVVGFPRNMDGRLGAKARESEHLAAKLREEGLTVVLWDERLTTAQAERQLLGAGFSHRKRKQRIDSMAAQIMLQSFLDAPGQGGI